jgi:PhnB protein
VALSLAYPTVSDAQRVFDLLADGGSITMPLQKTFWAEAHGSLIDRYGTRWMVSGGRVSH